MHLPSAQPDRSPSHPPVPSPRISLDILDRQMLTAGDVARIFGVSLKTVGRWASEGRLRSIRTPGGHRRFWAEDIAAVAQQPQTPQL